MIKRGVERVFSLKLILINNINLSYSNLSRSMMNIYTLSK